ncbi:MAG TPA: P-II family nitrogen regulator [Smithellaceae bacterium]|jgi:nitrogen regulatory protein PII|nr:P-II family nitrogen regulator [Smithellaceae bacterium]
MSNEMINTCEHNIFEALYVIVDWGRGGRIIKTAKQHGILGATVFLERGTVENRLLDLLGLCTVKKEMVLMVTEQKVAFETLEILNRKYSFDKANGGIAFCIPVARVYGARCYENILPDDDEGGGEDKTMYRAIFTIVDRGRAEDVMDAANEVGAKGGTIINARGSGIHETNKLFSMEIEPEKEMVMILSEKSVVDSIVSSIRKKLDIDKPGKGIIFVQEVSRAYGLR